MKRFIEVEQQLKARGVRLTDQRRLAVRRAVSFAEAVYAGRVTVEGVTARLAPDPMVGMAYTVLDEIPVVVDADGTVVSQMRPPIVVDARMAKRNLGAARAARRRAGAGLHRRAGLPRRRRDESRAQPGARVLGGEHRAGHRRAGAGERVQRLAGVARAG